MFSIFLDQDWFSAVSGSGSKDGKSGKDNASPCGPYAGKFAFYILHLSLLYFYDWDNTYRQLESQARTAKIVKLRRFFLVTSSSPIVESSLHTVRVLYS